MEGPFLNLKRKGAQKKEHIVAPDKLFFDVCFEASGMRIRKLTPARALEADKLIGMIAVGQKVDLVLTDDRFRLRKCVISFPVRTALPRTGNIMTVIE